MNVALFCVLKNESIYVNEYIDHYINLGFNHIYLCDNSSNNELDNIVNAHVFKDYVTIINIRSQDVIKGFTPAQSIIYTLLYNTYNHLYDWLCFFDIDEFLVLNKDKSIQEYLSRDMFNGVDQIHIDWLIFSDNNQLHYSNEPVMKRFTKISDRYYNIYKEYAYGIKSILRSNLNLRFLTPHTAISNDANKLITVTSAGLLINENFSSHSSGSYEYAQLNHYVTKSTEEYLHKNFQNNSSNILIKRYFDINEYSDDKYNMLRSLFDMI